MLAVIKGKSKSNDARRIIRRTTREVKSVQEETFEIVDEEVVKHAVNTVTETTETREIEEAFEIVDQPKVERRTQHKFISIVASLAHASLSWGTPLATMAGIYVWPPLLIARFGFTLYECSFWVCASIKHREILLLHTGILLDDKDSRNKLFNDALSIDFLKSCITQGSHDTAIKTILLLYCKYGKVDEAKNLLTESQININDRINNFISPLELVCQSGNKELLIILLDHAKLYGDDLFPSARSITPALLIAFENKHYDLVGILLDYGASPDIYVSYVERKTILHCVVEKVELSDEAQVKALIKLIESSSRLDTPDITGEFPLDPLFKKEAMPPTLSECLRNIEASTVWENIPIQGGSKEYRLNLDTAKSGNHPTPSTPINPLLVGSFIAKETIESLPIIKSFLNIYQLDASWLSYNSFWSAAHFIATYAGSISLGLFDPTKAITVNAVYMAKQNLREKLLEDYQQAEHIAINSSMEFGEKCGSYIMKQALLGGLITGRLDIITAMGALNNALSSGFECYYLYNRPLEDQSHNSIAYQGAKYVAYPAVMYYSYKNTDFSDNSMAMLSYKQVITTMNLIVVADQLLGEYEMMV